MTNGAVAVIPVEGGYAVSTDYTILSADGGLGGTTFETVSSSLAFLEPTLSYDANNVYLNLTRNEVNFVDATRTPNQVAVANALTNLFADNPEAIQDIVDNLLTLTTTGAQQAFDSLSGVQHTHGQLVTSWLSRRFIRLLFDHGSDGITNSALAIRRQQAFDPFSGTLLAANGNDWPLLAAGDTRNKAANKPSTRERGWWSGGFGGFGDIDSTSNANGADYDSAAFAIGVDAAWGDLVVGIAGSYAGSNVDTAQGNLDINSFQVAGYGTWRHACFYADAAIGFAYHDTESKRAVTVGLDTRTSRADYDSNNISAFVGIGKELPVSESTTFTLHLDVEYSHDNRDDFSERGAGSASLSMSDESLDSLRTRVGVRLSRIITTEKGLPITPSVSVGYVREHLDDVAKMAASFTPAPTVTFRVAGTELDRDRAHLGVQIRGHLSERTTLNFGYSGEIAGSDDNHSFAATIRAVW